MVVIKVEDLEETIELDPDDAEAYNDLDEANRCL